MLWSLTSVSFSHHILFKFLLKIPCLLYAPFIPHIFLFSICLDVIHSIFITLQVILTTFNKTYLIVDLKFKVPPPPAQLPLSSAGAWPLEGFKSNHACTMSPNSSVQPSSPSQVLIFSVVLLFVDPVCLHLSRGLFFLFSLFLLTFQMSKILSGNLIPLFEGNTLEVILVRTWW